MRGQARARLADVSRPWTSLPGAYVHLSNQASQKNILNQVIIIQSCSVSKSTKNPYLYLGACFGDLIR